MVRSWWPGPKLRVLPHNPLGELTTLADGTPVRYYHLTVTNDRKWSTAHNVRVLLTNIFQPAADGSWVDRSFGGPLQLTWQSPELHEQYPSIGPDYVSDLGCIVKGRQFGLTPYVIPNDFNGFVGPNQSIRVKVVAVADNGKSEPALIEIAWNGNWSDEAEEMGHHLIVEKVTGQPGARANRPSSGLRRSFPIWRGTIDQDHYSPEFEKRQFCCIHCNVFAYQYWFGLYIHYPPETSTQFKVSRCSHCGKRTYWYDGRMIIPTQALSERAKEAIEKGDYIQPHSTTTV